MWIHNDVEIEYDTTWKYKVLWTFFKGKFKHYDEFVAVSEGIVAPFRRKTGLFEPPITVIPNMIDTADIFEKANAECDLEVSSDRTNFCFVGRLTKQKGIDILLDCFAKALKLRNDIHLYIIGDGEEHVKIENQINSLNIGNSVTMLGAKSNPYCYMDKMDALVLTSRHEGQGMVLLEGKALGLDLIFSKNLERYTNGLVGSDDIAGAIAAEHKHEKVYDSLEEYNDSIKRKLYELFDK